MNSSRDAVESLIAALNRLDIPYMIVGSFSSNLYGVERSTRDADFVIESDSRIHELADIIKPAWRMDHQIGFETKLMTTRYHFYHDATGFKAELFLLGDDEHDQTRFARRRKIHHEDQHAFFPTAEDVVIQKLRWGRIKDRMDLKDVIDLQGDTLDWPYIHAWCEKHGTRGLLDDIRYGPE